MKKRFMHPMFLLIILTPSVFAQTEGIKLTQANAPLPVTNASTPITPIECTYTLIALPNRNCDDSSLFASQNSCQASYSCPYIPVALGASQNWSGYAALSNFTNPAVGSVTYVAGSWVVPTLSRSNGTYSAFWVGMDGYGSNSVEQIGTQHNWVNGKQQNYAWFEIYPNYSYMINGFPVNAGDTISASVSFQGNGVFLLTMINNTQKVSVTVPTFYTTSYDAPRASAEWIIEAPFYNGMLPLAHFGTAQFSNCIATINGLSGSISCNAYRNALITMTTSAGIQKAMPSALSTDGQSFTVAWMHE